MTESPARTSFIVSRPVAIGMVFLAAVVFGYLSLGRLPVTLMPELTYPTLTVRTEYPGAAPEEVENDISRPVEEAVGVVAGLRKLSSISRAGISDVVLEFAWDTTMSEATQDVLEKLDLVFLPEEAKRPLMLHYDPSLDPVMELSLSGKGERFKGEAGLRRLRRLADLQIRKQLEPIKGVAAVRVRGGLEEEIHVLLEEEALRRSGISIQRVIDRVAEENINVAGGTLKEGRIEYLVRTLNEFEDLDQIAETVVARFDNREVRIKDLGQVVRAHREREILTRTDGGESVQIEIFKEGDANIVALARRVRGALGEFDPAQAEAEGEEEDAAAGAGASAGGAPGGPAGPSGLAETIYREEGALLGIVADRSLFIQSSIREVRNTAILGGLLAVVVLYLFLRRFKTTAIIAVSIPISLLIAFAPLNLLGVSLNIMSLGGLALGIGMLVDSSIVVLESVYRCREEGDGVQSAAVRGTREVRGAVFASTLTSIAVFFPMVFVEGIAGQAFGDLGLAVVVSLLAAAAVALFFIPMLASRTGFGRAGKLASGLPFVLQANRGQSAPQRPRGVAGIVRWPLFALGALVRFHTRHVRGAWSDLRRVWFALPRWFRILNVHNFALQIVLTPLLPYLARWIGIILDRYYAILCRMWVELRDDFRASPLWVKIVAAPFWLIRSVLIVPLPHVLLPWPWIFTFNSRSWALVRDDFRSLSRRWKSVVVFTLLPLVYLLLRLLLGAVFEGLGWVIMQAYTVLAVIVVVSAIVLGRLLKLLLAVPAKMTDLAMGGLNRVYPRLLRSALARPLVVVLVVLGCFWITWQVVRGLDSELLPEVHQGEFTVEVKLPVGTPLEETESVVAPIEQAILGEKQNIESLILTAGYDSVNSQRSDEGEHTARFKVVLDEASRSPEAEGEVIGRLRDKFSGIPDLDARIVRPVLFSSKTPIEVEVHGTDLRQLKQYGDRARDAMAAMPELADVETSLQSGAPEVQIVYDRNRVALYGLNIRDVARLVRDKVQGYEATKFNLKDRRIPIVVRLSMDDRETVDDVRGLIINPGVERPIRLASVAEVTLGEGPSEVRRIDGRRVALISANIAEGSLSAATLKIEDRLRRQIEWPVEMTFLISGQNEEWQRSQKSLWIALGLSIFLVYVIMAAQFESLLHPFVIMLTIPLAFVGTVITLKMLGLSLSVVVFLGMIMLAGIVVNNAIVLVDYINQLRRRGLPRDEAIVTAGKVRLRPILMTTATTVLGLTPMALGLGDGAEIRTPMAIAVISGLISSTALTLVVIPSVYAVVDSLKQRILGRRAELLGAADESAALAGPESQAVTP